MHKTLTLNNGMKMPVIGIGTWKMEKDKAPDAIKYAIDVGYRHIDCAREYGNQAEVGKGLKAALESKDLRRENLFVASKLWNTDHAKDRVEPACRETLKELGLDYLDCYMIHWPIAFEYQGRNEPNPKDEQGNPKVDQSIPIKETWQAMEALVDKGLVKCIGVSNFSTEQVDDLLSYAKIKPVVNQVELHPYLIGVQDALCKHHEKKGIKVIAYAPLGHGSSDNHESPLEDERVKNIAKKYRKTPGQILIRWNIDYGNAAIPKSQSREHIRENFDVFDFHLSDEEVEQITQLGDEKCKRMVNPKLRSGGEKFFPEHETPTRDKKK